MAERQFSSTAQPMTLSAAINSATPTIVVNTVAGLPPATPFTLVLDRGEQAEEIVTVTAIAGNTLTVIRGEDGTSAQAHGMGAAVRHMMTARDLREVHQHAAATTGVHGLQNGSTLVGTTTVQTLTSKTIDGTKNTISNVAQASVSGLPTALVTEQQAREAVNARVNTEIADRGAAVTAEATARAAADTALGGRVTTLEGQPTQWRANSTARPTSLTVKDSDLLYEPDTQIIRIREAGQWRHIGGTPGFYAERSSIKNIAPLVFTTIDGLTEIYDDLNVFDSNLGVFTCPVAGVWEFRVGANIGQNAVATSIASRLANGPLNAEGSQWSLATYDLRYTQTGGTNWQTTGFSAEVKLAKDDQVRFQAWQYSGNTQGMLNFSFGGRLRRADPVSF